MKWQKIVSHDGLNDFTAPSTIGGRFNVSMIGSDKDSKLRNAMYLAEIGPSQYHIAYYIVYKLDRLLGVGFKEHSFSINVAICVCVYLCKEKMGKLVFSIFTVSTIYCIVYVN